MCIRDYKKPDVGIPHLAFVLSINQQTDLKLCNSRELDGVFLNKIYFFKAKIQNREHNNSLNKNPQRYPFIPQKGTK